MTTAATDLRYPVGKFEPKPFSTEQKNKWIHDIELLPGMVEYAVINLDAAQLNTPYRDGGWTVQQLIHHIADSHLNAYLRFKLGLTEDNPTIKPYDQSAWAELDDIKLPVNISLTLLHALHARWIATIKNLPDEAWERTVFHPEHQKTFTLWHFLGMYAWHGKHHVAHINSLRERMGW